MRDPQQIVSQAWPSLWASGQIMLKRGANYYEMKKLDPKKHRARRNELNAIKRQKNA